MGTGTGFGKTILIGDQFVLEEVPAAIEQRRSAWGPPLRIGPRQPALPRRRSIGDIVAITAGWPRWPKKPAKRD